MHPRPLSSGVRMIKFKLRHKETETTRPESAESSGGRWLVQLAGLPLVEAGHVPVMFRDRQMRMMLGEF